MMQLYVFSLFVLITCCKVQTSLTQNSPACQTPLRTEGQCVPVANCNYFKEILHHYGPDIPTHVLNFLRESRCFTTDRNEVRICCSLNKIMNTATPTSTTSTHKPNTHVRLPSPLEGYDTIFTTDQGNFEGTLDRNAVNILRNFTCGVSNNDRVSFGTVTKVGEFPWVALLRYNNQNMPFQCGGTLVSHRYVVTAAHCIVGTPDPLIGVRLGEHDLEQVEDCLQIFDQQYCYKAEDFEIEKAYSHPNYSRYKLINDVGLIRISRDVVFKGNIQPICLPLTNVAAQVREYPDKYIIAGWGKTETDEPAKKMIKAELPPQNRSHCQHIFKKPDIRMAHLCAGGENRVDSCKGDSGGPLFASTLYERTIRYVLYGVVSFGIAKCGDENSYPGIYTNVVQFMPWITANIS